jgi:choline dehydrogenase-like flavoprotein
MTRLLVVGSGASGVHLALTALERGFEVTLVDAGFPRASRPEPDASIDQLKDRLPDPVGYFLGPGGEGVAYPATKPSYYAHPPSKSYVFRVPDRFATRSSNMEPVFSFARGGLAEAWTAGAYAFNPDDLREFPIPFGEMSDAYRTVIRRIGVGGERDDLEARIPFDAEYQPSLPLDPHSERLLERYRARRGRLLAAGFRLGRSRVATLSRAHGGRPACTQLGRCFWGCPTDAIYSPAVTLAECERHPKFRYCPGLLATHFSIGADGRVSRIHAEEVDTGAPREFEADVFALAAGALATSKLVLDSIHRQTGRIERLGGLMDNRQVHVPFLTPGMIGRPVSTASYQFHHLAFGLDAPDPTEYVHGQITTLKAAAIHPIVQSLPLDSRSALALFRALRAGLGLANVNLHDRRRPESHVTIRPIDGPRTELLVNYVDDPAEPAAIAAAVSRLRRSLRELGSIVPARMTRVLPKGVSVHYAGTIPMASGGGLSCTPDCRVRDFPNLIVGDGASFPFLPAKNLTLTLMANAHRIATRLDPADR